MKGRICSTAWAFALAAVIGFAMPRFAMAQCPKNGTMIATSGILIYNGQGTTNGTNGDVDNLENVISSNLGLDCDAYDIKGWSVAKLTAYKLLIIPGGDSITIGNYFYGDGDSDDNTLANIKTAVRMYGLHYLGVCAGAFLASYAGTSGYHDIDLLDGIWFDLLTGTPCGINTCTEELSNPDGSTIYVYWEDGPQLTTQGGTWSGSTIVAKYANGQPAIIQGMAGKGYTLLQGVHPEAGHNWSCGTGCCDFHSTTAAQDLAYSAALINAALTGNPLKSFP